MKSFIMITLILSVVHVHSQVMIKGKLVDAASESSLSYATISIYSAKDTGLIACRVSTYKGDFTIPGIPLNVPCRMIVYDSGYVVYRKEFTLTSDHAVEWGNINMDGDSAFSEEAIAAAEQPPVIIHKKYIQFNPPSFKALSGKFASSPLMKLPGIYVDDEGNITASGEKLKKLIINDMSLLGSLQ